MSKKINKLDLGALYTKLLQVQRFRPSQADRPTSLSVEAASDRGRILFSNAFRRLQSKTQVFDQERNAAVRTRLSHSLEVASIGRYIAELATRRMLKQGWLGPLPDETTLEKAAAMVTFVEVACLMHDLGNPPFGHFGENTMQSWFSIKQDSFRKQLEPKVSAAFDAAYLDLIHFDGNPQGFRMATKLQWVKDEFGYNLTHTQLAAVLKYPWTPEKIGAKINGKVVRKAGVFSSEKERLEQIRTVLGLKPGARHPLAYLMEAADDISYCLSDIEDALEKRVITAYDFIAFLKAHTAESTDSTVQRVRNSLPTDAHDSPKGESPTAWYVKFRTDVTNALVVDASRLFEEHQLEIAAGNYFDLLDKSQAASSLLGAVKEYATQRLYTCETVRKRELVGFEVISGILERFGMLLNMPGDDAYDLLAGQSPKLATKYRLAPTLVSFLGRKQLLAYQHSVTATNEKTSDPEKRRLSEWFARAHLLADYVSGMTDDFAIVMFQRLYAGGLIQI